ncbi:MAG: HAD-IIB family hydrolase [Spirochaetales bacterium]|nr:HAD-IIB family hydrolase [Spirochaetales bacterium]
MGNHSKGHNKPKNIKEIQEKFCKNLNFLFTDIDDTITTDGLMDSSAFNAVWKIFKAGIKVVPVTGRPAGWCDHIARMWPVAGVIGENGSFYFSYNHTTKKMKRRYFLSGKERDKNQKKLKAIGERIIREVPGSMIASDQPFRISDLAIDYREDIEPLGKQEVNKICRIMEEEGATYKVSSIHVNCWFGDYDKVACLKQFLKDTTGAEMDTLNERIIFIGDSPNDEPMFKELPYTVAVSNINKFLDDITNLPRYITQNTSGKGFEEMVNIIIGKRNL